MAAQIYWAPRQELKVFLPSLFVIKCLVISDPQSYYERSRISTIRPFDSQANDIFKTVPGRVERTGAKDCLN